jgi:hypothetical protein
LVREQIGRIFAHWVIAHFGHIFENLKSDVSHFFHGEGCALILTKNGLCKIWGDFFPNSSGRPVCR